MPPTATSVYSDHVTLKWGQSIKLPAVQLSCVVSHWPSLDRNHWLMPGPDVDFRSAEFAGTGHRLLVATLQIRVNSIEMAPSNQVRLDVRRLRDESLLKSTSGKSRRTEWILRHWESLDWLRDPRNLIDTVVYYTSPMGLTLRHFSLRLRGVVFSWMFYSSALKIAINDSAGIISP